jgi:hypothetical protein
MEKIKVKYVGQSDCIVMCASLNSRVKKDEIIKITEQEALELGDLFQLVQVKKGEK